MTAVRTFDTITTRFIAMLPNWLRSPFTILGHMTTPLAWALALVAFIVLREPTGFSEAMFILAAVPLATVSKFLFRRQRPPTIYAGSMRIKSYSFPSSHAYAAALAGGYFIYVINSATSTILALCAAVIPIVIGVSRVYLGAHYPSDVVAGWLLGITLLTGIVWVA